MKGTVMSDVKTLIAALTTERNAIDRAIAGLQAMSEIRAEKQAPLLSARKVRPRVRRATKRIYLSDAVKTVIAERMSQAAHGQGQQLATTLAKEFGGSRSTIYMNWRNWQTSDNGAAATEPVATEVSA